MYECVASKIAQMLCECMCTGTYWTLSGYYKKCTYGLLTIDKNLKRLAK